MELPALSSWGCISAAWLARPAEWPMEAARLVLVAWPGSVWGEFEGSLIVVLSEGSV